MNEQRREDADGQEPTPNQQIPLPLEGLVREPVSERTESLSFGTRRVLSFRLQIVDPATGNVARKAVEMYAIGFEGFVALSEEVSVHGRWRRQGILRANRIENHTTQTWVTKRGYPIIWWIGLVFAILVVLGFVGGLIAFLIAMASQASI